VRCASNNDCILVAGLRKSTYESADGTINDDEEVVVSAAACCYHATLFIKDGRIFSLLGDVHSSSSRSIKCSRMQTILILGFRMLFYTPPWSHPL